MNLAAQTVDDSYNYGDWLELVRNWLDWQYQKVSSLSLGKDTFLLCGTAGLHFIYHSF